MIFFDQDQKDCTFICLNISLPYLGGWQVSFREETVALEIDSKGHKCLFVCEIYTLNFKLQACSMKVSLRLVVALC